MLPSVRKRIIIGCHKQKKAFHHYSGTRTFFFILIHVCTGVFYFLFFFHKIMSIDLTVRALHFDSIARIISQTVTSALKNKRIMHSLKNGVDIAVCFEIRNGICFRCPPSISLLYAAMK